MYRASPFSALGLCSASSPIARALSSARSRTVSSPSSYVSRPNTLFCIQGKVLCSQGFFIDCLCVVATEEHVLKDILTSLAKPGGGDFGKYFSLPVLNDPRVDKLPYSIQILLESAINNCDNFQITKDDVEKILDWENTSHKQVEIPLKPAHVLQQDFTGVPATVDLAAMRDAMDDLNSDPKKIKPLVPVDLVIDHSVQVDLARFRAQQVKPWIKTSFAPGSGAVTKYLLESIVLAGAEYGSGSSRDWAAKGPMLLGVKAVIAGSPKKHKDMQLGQDVDVVTDTGKSFTCTALFDTEFLSFIFADSPNLSRSLSLGTLGSFELIC
ncbi:hypothetical protein J5N97_027304 [Dioscorea zingiberensis]|uniref:Aconitase/3-isopropylmalate dehydratase large subunit alpha/beta/alpha domain-containing protein n=1 Tax=Dioscorea zingiberensis TaxID=325984 RepID=A0A9D5H7H2_9LILI|nr:hypothetical protein J5N97_027304 [Dioscorea zingiberensis]